LDKLASGTKYDDGKLRYDLIPAYPIEQLAAVFTFGAKKYSDWNWTKGIQYSRLIASLFRHFWAFVRGIDTDAESGLPHLAHVIWNAQALLYFSKYRKDLDDRKKDVPEDDKRTICGHYQPGSSISREQDNNTYSQGQLVQASQAQDRIGYDVQPGTAYSGSPQLTFWNDSPSNLYGEY
jgi:hypothetical protein